MRVGAVVPIAETTRSGVVESVHFGAVVALDADGIVAWSAGDPDTEVYPRSALKPLQAQAMFEAGFDRPARRACRRRCEPQRGASPPRGRPPASSTRPGSTRTTLGNTPALPLAPSVAADVLRAGGRASSLLQNCSGKHAAMLVDVGRQRLGRRRVPGTRPSRAEVDRHVHRRGGRRRRPHRHRRLRRADGDGDADRAGVRRRARWRAASRPSTWRCGSIPSSWPAPGREDTLLMRAVDGLVAKGGAEGVHVAAHRDGRAVAVKVADGGERARAAGDAGRPAIARLRCRRRPRAADPRARPPGRRDHAARRRRHLGRSVARRRFGADARNSGGRRCRYDCTPSWKSARAKLSAISRSASRSAAARPRCRSRYTWRFITAIDVGEECSARSTM